MRKIRSIAPGRTCLFGDHQDYLGLPVIACAIDRDIELNAIQNTTNVFNLNMLDINEVRIININETKYLLDLLNKSTKSKFDDDIFTDDVLNKFDIKL